MGKPFPISRLCHGWVLRGNLKAGQDLKASFSARQHNPPKLPEGETCLFAAEFSRNAWKVLHVEKADEAKIKQITATCRLPLGWKVDKEDNATSPWASLGKAGWDSEKNPAPVDTPVCSKTGRPALMAGSEVEFTVAKVPPPVNIKWTNPDGDGLYRVTVTNPTDHPIEVPALLTVDGKILWNESLVIECQKKYYTIPGSRLVSEKVKPLTLAPGESKSTVINTFLLDGPQWPRGGYRLNFVFCLGEKSVTKSFYYLSRHHDKVRAKSLSKDPV